MSVYQDELDRVKAKAKWFWAERMGWVIAVGVLAFIAFVSRASC